MPHLGTAITSPGSGLPSSPIPQAILHTAARAMLQKCQIQFLLCLTLSNGDPSPKIKAQPPPCIFPPPQVTRLLPNHQAHLEGRGSLPLLHCAPATPAPLVSCRPKLVPAPGFRVCTEPQCRLPCSPARKAASLSLCNMPPIARSATLSLSEGTAGALSPPPTGSPGAIPGPVPHCVLGMSALGQSCELGLDAGLSAGTALIDEADPVALLSGLPLCRDS